MSQICWEMAEIGITVAALVRPLCVNAVNVDALTVNAIPLTVKA